MICRMRSSVPPAAARTLRKAEFLAAVAAAVAMAAAAGVARRRATASRFSRPPKGVDFQSYINRLLAKLKQNWVAVMPESFYLGDKGIVAISFRINHDGSFSAESLSIDRTSGKEPLDTAAASAIRATSPFEPLPPQFKGPNLDLRIGFYYNIPIGDAPQ